LSPPPSLFHPFKTSPIPLLPPRSMSSLREGVASLYRGLDYDRTVSDTTFEKERVNVLAALGLIPSNMIDEVMGSTSQFNSAKAGLGLFARNRGVRKQKARGERETKSHKETVMDQQNLRKRLAYAKELNVLVGDMGDKFVNDEEIPINTWTEYDRLRRNPAYRQKTKQELELGPTCMEPGPGAYLNMKGGASGKRDKAIPVSFGKSERWQKETSVRRKGGEEEEEVDDVSKRLCLSQKKGMRWFENERLKLNELYWELGRPRKKIFTKDHLALYAKRHQVLFSNRPAAEIRERVSYMLKFNQFKEKGEVHYWEENKKKKENAMVKPGKNQRKEEKARESRSAGAGTSSTMKMAKGDLTMKAQETKADVKPAVKFRPLPKTPGEEGDEMPFSREAGSMYGGRMASPFTTSQSKFKEGPGFSFMSSSRGLSGDMAKFDANEECNEPFESSSIGVQLLSENKTLPALSFKRAGVGGINLSVGDKEQANEPTASTYTPQFQLVKPRIPAYGLSDRLNDEKWSDKFSAMTGPGSYEEGGSVGKQVLGTRGNAPRVTFSTQDRLKFMSNFAIA